MRPATDADEEDVATSIALVTLCGSLAILLLPLLRSPFGLDVHAFGVWVGASVHDVGQVVATGDRVPGALETAVVVKLSRVLLLAPLVALVVLHRRRTVPATSSAARPPVLPFFVAAFVVAVLVRATGLVPTSALDAVQHVQSVLLVAALFALGTGIDVPHLLRTGGRSLVLGLSSWVLVAGVSLAGVHLLHVGADRGGPPAPTSADAWAGRGPGVGPWAVGRAWAGRRAWAAWPGVGRAWGVPRGRAWAGRVGTPVGVPTTSPGRPPRDTHGSLHVGAPMGVPVGAPQASDRAWDRQGCRPPTGAPVPHLPTSRQAWVRGTGRGNPWVSPPVARATTSDTHGSLHVGAPMGVPVGVPVGAPGRAGPQSPNSASTTGTVVRRGGACDPSIRSTSSRAACRPTSTGS